MKPKNALIMGKIMAMLNQLTFVRIIEKLVFDKFFKKLTFDHHSLTTIFIKNIFISFSSYYYRQILCD